MLLVPRPPEFATYAAVGNEKGKSGEDIKVIGGGSDAIPAHTTQDTTDKYYRLLSIGKKRLPDVGTRKTAEGDFWGDSDGSG